MDWNAIINTLPFPIACVCACGWFIYTMYTNSNEENAVREERNYKMLGEFQITIDKFADILNIYEKKLTVIESDVKEIKVIVNK